MKTPPTLVMNQAFLKLEFETILRRLQHYAYSEPGKDAVRDLPFLTEAAPVHRELSLVSEVKSLIEQEGDLPLSGIHSIASALQKAGLEGAVLSPGEILQIGSTLRVVRLLKGVAQKRRSEAPLFWEICGELQIQKVLEFNIEQTIDETGTVRDDASKELRTIRRAVAERYEQLRKRLASILRNISAAGFSHDEIITTREGRMVIPVKAEHKNRIPGFVHSESSSGATVFVEPTETLELNNEIRNLQFQEQREIDRLLRVLTAQVREEREEILKSADILARVDSLHARAKYSLEILGVQPAVSEEGPLHLLGVRHPILIMHLGYNHTVPMDLALGDTFTTLVISGPNAGGKSVAMKCVGLVSLMTQSGLHIPAAPASIVRVFRKIFVDIGDDQSIENDLSTFSSHLSHLKEIAESVDRDSLVLIDEIGSGTDPAEGGALAAAFLEKITKVASFCIATTHHGSLKIFAHTTAGVENGAMEFDQTTLTPTYRFRAGVPGSSYALEMASRLGLHSELLLRARELLGTEHSDLERLIFELESTLQVHREVSEKLEKDSRAAEELKLHYESKLAEEAREARSRKKSAETEARQIVEQANALIERSIREIREKGAEKESVRIVRSAIENLKRDLDQNIGDPQPPGAQFDAKPGASVVLHDGNEVGDIESVSHDGKAAIVLFGNVRLKVAATDLRSAKGKKKPTVSSRPVEQPIESDPMLRDLDLRGMTGEEALPLIDKFLDTAILAGLHRVDIIHGKGTGALRKKVTDFLSHHPRVKSFRLGEWNEGGSGATVVEL